MRHVPDDRLRLSLQRISAEAGSARGVQIDIDGGRLSLRYPMEINLVGDSATTLAALLPMLRQKAAGAWRKGIEEGVAAWWTLLEQRAMQAADPDQPASAFLGIVETAAR